MMIGMMMITENGVDDNSEDDKDDNDNHIENDIVCELINCQFVILSSNVSGPDNTGEAGVQARMG